MPIKSEDEENLDEVGNVDNDDIDEAAARCVCFISWLRYVSFFAHMPAMLSCENAYNYVCCPYRMKQLQHTLDPKLNQQESRDVLF